MIIYNILLNILFLPLLLLLFIIAIFNKRIRITFFDRLGFNGIKQFKNKPIWFHCSSLGEFNAIKNVIIALKEQYNDIFVTTLTDTGFNAARKFLGADNVSILPLDFNFLLRIFIKKLSPLLLIIEETEIWPNMIFQTGENGIPVIYTNCIISEKSYKFHKNLSFIFKSVLNVIDIFFIQNEQTGEYLKKMGISKKKISYIGNIKFDINITAKSSEGKLKKQLNLKNNFIITAGSTRKGEEKILLYAFKKIINTERNCRMIIIPRHLDRISEIKDTLEQLDLKYVLYSNMKKQYKLFAKQKQWGQEVMK